MRVRNAGPTGFETRVQEWAYLDGVHDVPERAFYLVAEAGVHDLGGLLVEARRLDTAQIARSGFESVAFAESMGDVPAVFAGVMTEHDPAPVTARIHARTPEGFGLALQEEELAGGGHGVETLGWIAVQRGTGVTEQDRVLRVVDAQSDHTLNRIGFLRKFTFVVGGVSSYRGEDPVELKYVSLDPTGVVVFLQEESSYDDETTHVLEDVSIFAAE
jgi:hypothetical protein